MALWLTGASITPFFPSLASHMLLLCVLTLTCITAAKLAGRQGRVAPSKEVRGWCSRDIAAGLEGREEMMGGGTCYDEGSGAGWGKFGGRLGQRHHGMGCSQGWSFFQTLLCCQGMPQPLLLLAAGIGIARNTSLGTGHHCPFAQN